MTRPLLLLTPLPVILALLACGAASKPPDVVPVTAQPGWTAFFDRPLALAAARKSGVPSPVVILLETNPWLNVIGSDSPAFALYDDGTAIYRTAAGYKSVKLEKAGRDELMRSLDVAALSHLAGGYQATLRTDQPRTSLLVYGGAKPFYISVYGSLKSAEVRSKLPGRIVAAYDQLQAFDQPTARPWLPAKIEVMIWPYDYAPGPSIVWPKAWPGLNDAMTRKRGNSYSIFLPAADLEALKALLGSRKEKGAVEIGGKKWAASIRLPFAHENLWMGPKSE